MRGLKRTIIFSRSRSYVEKDFSHAQHPILQHSRNPLMGEAMGTLADVLRNRRSLADYPALTFYCNGALQERIGFQELCQRTATAAANLKAHGVKPGDRVVILSTNCPEMYCLCLAIMAMGAIVAPANPQEAPRILRHMMQILEPSLVVVGVNVSAHFDKVALPCPKTNLSSLFDLAVREVFNFSDTEVRADDVAVILFTSGTTSEPKGVCLSHFNLLTNARGLAETHQLDKHKVHMCVLPLFHANAFGFSLVGSIFAGSHVILSDGLPGQATWSILEKEAVNIISVVPQILPLLAVRPPATPLTNLRYFVSAAAPLSRKIAADFVRATGVRIHQGYGLSECVNFATTIPGDIDEQTYELAMFGEKVPSIGCPLQGCDVHVAQPDRDGLVGPDHEGELVVTGDTLMQGYWRNAEATARTIVGGGLRTGDLGFYRVLAGRRFFFISGRKKEIIVRRGEKISPLSVEAELQRLLEFGKFAVTGFENEWAGEEIGLYLKLDRAADRDAAIQIVHDCPALLRPRLVVFGSEPIPATPTGKVKRALLSTWFGPYASQIFGTTPLVVDLPPSI